MDGISAAEGHWLLVHRPEGPCPGPCCCYQHDCASLVDSTDHSNHILRYLQFRAGETFWERPVSEVQGTELALLPGKIWCAQQQNWTQGTVLRHSTVLSIQQHSHQGLDTLRLFDRPPDILYYLHFAYCYFDREREHLHLSNFTNLLQKFNFHLGHQLMSHSAVSAIS